MFLIFVFMPLSLQILGQYSVPVANIFGFREVVHVKPFFTLATPIFIVGMRLFALPKHFSWHLCNSWLIDDTSFIRAQIFLVQLVITTITTTNKQTRNLKLSLHSYQMKLSIFLLHLKLHTPCSVVAKK